MRDLDPSRIRTGHGQIDPVFLDTPVIRWSADGAGRGTEIIFKDERASPIRSFKGRGADLLVRAFPPATDFVCASAGNFGQGMAWAARRRAGRVLVFAARTAARCKIEAMRELGAQVVLEGASFDEAKHAARAFAAGSDKIFVEDGVHPELAEGAGTIALELTDQFDALDAIFVPLGNGSLAAGIGCWFKRHSPRTRVVAVCAAGAPAMGLAVLGQAFHAAGCSTIADGIAVRVPDPSAVAAVRRVVDKVLFVDDGDIRRAMALIEEITLDRVEPAGAAGLAGLHASRDGEWGARVAVPLCGGNADPDAASDLVNLEIRASGRRSTRRSPAYCRNSGAARCRIEALRELGAQVVPEGEFGGAASP